MMEIIISQNDNQLINTENENIQEINITQNENQLISLQNYTAQDIDIHENENQLILVNDIPVNITDVLVNGVSVVSNNIAYVIVPTKTSELTNDSGYITNETDPTVPDYVKEISLADINNWNNKQNELISGSNIKTINSTSLLGSGNINITGTTYTAGTGININYSNVISNTITSYNDLTDLPTIPTTTSELINNSDYITHIDLTNDLASVAFTGSYDDLADTPTIPTVNDATLTIQQNGTNVQTFTANQSTNATANIIVPTFTSDLSNDSGFISESDYASSLHGGTIKAGVNSYDINSVGQLYAETQSYADYGTMANTNFIGKGTLENVLSGKGYITNSVNDLTNYMLTSDINTALGNKQDTLTVTNNTYTTNGFTLRFIKYGRTVQVIAEGGTNTALTGGTDYTVTIDSKYTPLYDLRTNMLFIENGTRIYFTVSGTTVSYRISASISGTAYPRFSTTYISSS